MSAESLPFQESLCNFIWFYYNCISGTFYMWHYPYVEVYVIAIPTLSALSAVIWLATTTSERLDYVKKIIQTFPFRCGHSTWFLY